MPPVKLGRRSCVEAYNQNSSLQEVAPLSYAFIGSYFLNPFYSRYEEALNLASVRLLAASSDDEGGHEPGSVGKAAGGTTAMPRPYTLVRAKNVGMTSILLFARDPSAVHGIQEAECGFGAADMGNKGAVALRVSWGDKPRTTEVTLVATHLAAMEWNLKKRNANWRTIMSGLTFANPRIVLPGLFPSDETTVPTPDRSGAGQRAAPPAESSESSEVEDDEADAPPITKPLLPNGLRLTPEQNSTLREISIFKPTSHLFVAGDLNYRISTSTPPPLAPFPSFDSSSANHYPTFLSRDQLTQERLSGRAFHGMSEAPITFGPTYKYEVQSSPSGAENEASVRAGAAINGIPEVPWRFASHRWPGWCDRVLYLDLPSWLSSTDKKKRAIGVKAYDSLPVIRTSDHRPVFLRVSIPVVSADEMALPKEVVAKSFVGGWGLDGQRDPRATPPVPVDVYAWERRAAARRKEIIVGWSAFFWSTKEGAVVLATLLTLVVGAWWLWSMA